MAPFSIFFLILLAEAIHVQVKVNKVINTVPDEFISVNIDSASLFSGDRIPLDFRNKDLVFFTRQLAPAILRIGGSTADSTLIDINGYFAAHPDEIPSGTDVLISKSYWDDISQFCLDANLPLLFDLNHHGLLDASHRWNDSNAISLFHYLNNDPLKRQRLVFGWQLGNEPGHWDIRGPPDKKFTIEELGNSFLRLRKLIPSSEKLFGPDVCGPFSPKCANETFLEEFLKVSAPVLDGVTVHYYPISPEQCVLDSFTDPSILDTSDTVLSAWKNIIQKHGNDPVLGETASSPDGGCANLSNTFASGFFWIDQLGRAARMGYKYVFRQDLVGWSGISTTSSYALLGDPGWTHGEDLMPNPDFFTSVLWKLVMGNKVLDVSYNERMGQTRVFASSSINHIGLAFINMLNESVPLQLKIEGIECSGIREDYILTSGDAGLSSRSIFLNGKVLKRDSKDLFKWRQSVPTQRALTVPPLSYGFIAFRGIANEISSSSLL